jgi:hypothetical protein
VQGSLPPNLYLTRLYYKNIKNILHVFYRFYFYNLIVGGGEYVYIVLKLWVYEVFSVELLNLCFYVLKFELLMIFNCCIVLMFFLILELLYFYALRRFCNART